MIRYFRRSLHFSVLSKSCDLKFKVIRHFEFLQYGPIGYDCSNSTGCQHVDIGPDRLWFESRILHTNL